MSSSIIKAMEEDRAKYIEELGDLSEKQLIEHIKEKLALVVEYKLPIEELLPRWFAEDAENIYQLIEMAPAMEMHNALAKYMADGNMVSPKVVQWFAERVYNPKLLHKKRGRKPTPMLHYHIQYWMHILSVDMGYTVTDAVGLLADCAAKSPEHVRDIWYSAPKASG